MRIDIDEIEECLRSGPTVLGKEMTLALIARLREAEAREQALAAHVDRLKGALGYAMLSVPEQHSYKADLRDARDSSPETSIARLIAEKQADALDGAAEAFDEMGGPAAYLASSCLKDSAAKIRRQAEQAEKESNE